VFDRAVVISMMKPLMTKKISTRRGAECSGQQLFKNRDLNFRVVPHHHHRGDSPQVLNRENGVATSVCPHWR
jgi:hypothetical protein